MHELCGKTSGVAGDCGLTRQVEFAIGKGREYNFLAKCFEEGFPKVDQLVHVQSQGNADGVFGNRILYITLQSIQLCEFPGKDIQLVVGDPIGHRTFAPVAAHIPFPIGECIDGKSTGVGAEPASRYLYRMFKCSQRFCVDDLRISLTMFFCMQSRTIGTHETCNSRSDNFRIQFLFECPQDCIVMEGAPLDNDMSAKAFGCCCTDYFIQGVLHHTNRESRADILNR